MYSSSCLFFFFLFGAILPVEVQKVRVKWEKNYIDSNNIFYLRIDMDDATKMNETALLHAWVFYII